MQLEQDALIVFVGRNLNESRLEYQGSIVIGITLLRPPQIDFVADYQDRWNRNPSGLPRFYFNRGSIFKIFHYSDLIGHKKESTVLHTSSS